jgi:penicillin G amidase
MRADRFVGAALLFGHLARHVIRRRPKLALSDRLAMLPRTGLPIAAPVMIYWDEHHIPFIKAETDDDLAVALGLVHGHLRLGQIEMMRLLSQGRVAEMTGPIGVEIDRLIRTLDIARAVPEIARDLPEETRRWLEAFLRGLNHCIATVEALPEEFRIFALRREPWGIADVLTLGRLVSADVNWIVWLRLLRLRRDPDWPLLWHRLLHHDIVSPEATGSERSASPLGLADAFGAALKSGSNSFVLSPARTASGAPLIASDPHLSLLLPNPWIVAGMLSPSQHAVGLMIPGLPFIALGRNRWIAWGGTSLHAASSDLVALPADGEAELRKREEVIAVRWGRPRKIRIRESRWGPIVTDIPWLRSGGEVLALRWIGHRPSDEVTAMLRANRARNWAEFRAALDGFAVPGQRMLYADPEGRIGQLMAAHLPRRRGLAVPDLATAAGEADGWDATITGAGLPFCIDPPEGFIASANERPESAGLPIGWHFSPPDRKRRLDQLLSSEAGLSVDAAAKIQRDVHWMAALGQRDMLLTWLSSAPRRAAREDGLIADLRGWDGAYGADSRGALAFELLSYHLARRLVGRRRREAYAASWGMRGMIWQDVQSTSAEERSRALSAALRDAASAMPRRAEWGGLHRLRLGHPLALMPLVGRAYRVADLPAAGGSETLLKTAHPLTAKRHASRYGSCARHISDLADADRNYFVLLGGQDGWLGSTTFADQVALWRRGEYVAVPLTPEAVAAAFPHRTELVPMSAASPPAGKPPA